MECLIIADDLTGACDAAAPFATRGYKTLAALHPAGELLADVLAISTDTRGGSVEVLGPLMHEVAAGFATQPPIIFKKIDSTLRGNVGAEIAAAMRAFDCEIAIATPAFPRMGRVVEAGQLTITGQPDFVPIDLVALFREQGWGDCAHVAVGQMSASNAALISVDAVCDADLDAIVTTMRNSPRRILWAGSSGLASALARTLPVGERAAARSRGLKPALFCLGSEHVVTQAQQAELLARLPSVLLLDQTTAAGEIADALRRGLHVVLRLPFGRVAPERLRALLSGVSQLISVLVVSGGDTASLLCRALDIGAIDLQGEVTIGIPHGAIRGGAFERCAVVTKSGGFGAPDALIEVADFFSCPKS